MTDRQMEQAIEKCIALSLENTEKLITIANEIDVSIDEIKPIYFNVWLYELSKNNFEGMSSQ